MYRCSSAVLRTALIASTAPIALFLALAPPARAQRLPDNVLPEHYALTLTPDLKAATFTGSEAIDVTLSAPTYTITLNATEIAFESVKVTADGKEQTATVSLDDKKEQATFSFPALIPAGKATLSIGYTGILNNKLRGFYLSKTDKRSYAVTQFESTDARRAYPSFDEPAFKATFDVTLVIDSADTGISNSPIESDAPGPIAGKHTLKFSTTPKMSTYLLVFLVGDFQCTSGEADGVQIRSCATPDKVALTPYSLDVAKFVLHYYNTYFGIPYPLKKLDLIAIPDFEAGAMENFGAITFRETTLLLDPKTASLRSQQVVSTDIAHEMAHQWFGDLVTMRWWDNVWLNEGFASWMENKPVAVMHPEWNIDQGIADDENSTLDIDAQPTTHAIRARADSREEIEEMFDGISYGKGSDVLLMIEHYLGAETFRQGVHNYLSQHLYSNATAEDFWNAQAETSHKPVDKIMESFVAQPGEPLLTFSQAGGGKAGVAQKRFFLSPSVQPDKAQRWSIPVCFKTASGRPDCQVLDPGQKTINVPAQELIFANADGVGYYRTAYPRRIYANLVASAEASLTPPERISFIGDEWAQVRSNKAAVGDYLDLVSAVKSDARSDVLKVAIGNVNSIYERVAGTPEDRAALAAWIEKTFKPVLTGLGPPADNDSPNTRQMRAQLFNLLGSYAKDPDVLAQSREITDKYLADPSSVDATLGQTAAAIAARNGDAALFDRLQKLAETATEPGFRANALHMLAEFQDPVLVARSLDYAVSGKVRNQDALLQVANALRTDATRDQAWNFVKSHWSSLQPLLTPELGSILVSSSSRFCSVEARDDVKAYYTEHKVPSSERTLKHALENIDGCIEFRSLQQQNLRKWLAAQPRL